MRRAIVNLAGLGGVAMLLASGWVWWNFLRPLPSDATLRRQFLAHREVRASGRLEVRQRLDRAGLPSISRSQDGRMVWFTVRSNVRARKGIVYSEKPLKPIHASLDGRDRETFGYAEQGFVPLAPEWFLFLLPSD